MRHTLTFSDFRIKQTSLRASKKHLYFSVLIHDIGPMHWRHQLFVMPFSPSSTCSVSLSSKYFSHLFFKSNLKSVFWSRNWKYAVTVFGHKIHLYRHIYIYFGLHNLSSNRKGSNLSEVLYLCFSVPHLRHSYITIRHQFPIPCWQKSVSCVISYHFKSIGTSRWCIKLRPPVFCFSGENSLNSGIGSGLDRYWTK